MSLPEAVVPFKISWKLTEIIWCLSSRIINIIVIILTIIIFNIIVTINFIIKFISGRWAREPLARCTKASSKRPKMGRWGFFCFFFSLRGATFGGWFYWVNFFSGKIIFFMINHNCQDKKGYRCYIQLVVLTGCLSKGGNIWFFLLHILVFFDYCLIIFKQRGRSFLPPMSQSVLLLSSHSMKEIGKEECVGGKMFSFIEVKKRTFSEHFFSAGCRDRGCRQNIARAVDQPRY